MSKRIKITKILARTGEMAYQLQSLHFADFRPPATGWRPAVNAYACDTGFEICVDLAGVKQEDITVEVEPQRVTIRGERRLPMPCTNSCCRQVLTMEIENGPFQHTLSLPMPVDPNRVSARQDSGLLWITLTLQNKS